MGTRGAKGTRMTGLNRKEARNIANPSSTLQQLTRN